MYWLCENVEAPKSTVAFGASKKTINPVRGLQILCHSRILLHYRGASFKITMAKLVNSPLNLFVLNWVCPMYCISKFMKNAHPYYNSYAILESWWSDYIPALLLNKNLKKKLWGGPNSFTRHLLKNVNSNFQFQQVFALWPIRIKIHRMFTFIYM